MGLHLVTTYYTCEERAACELCVDEETRLDLDNVPVDVMFGVFAHPTDQPCGRPHTDRYGEEGLLLWMSLAELLDSEDGEQESPQQSALLKACEAILRNLRSISRHCITKQCFAITNKILRNTKKILRNTNKILRKICSQLAKDFLCIAKEFVCIRKNFVCNCEENDIVLQCLHFRCITKQFFARI